jgi:hypothetical protein
LFVSVPNALDASTLYARSLKLEQIQTGYAVATKTGPTKVRNNVLPSRVTYT